MAWPDQLVHDISLHSGIVSGETADLPTTDYLLLRFEWTFSTQGQKLANVPQHGSLPSRRAPRGTPGVDFINQFQSKFTDKT
jgi:hypothetical protein